MRHSAAVDQMWLRSAHADAVQREGGRVGDGSETFGEYRFLDYFYEGANGLPIESWGLEYFVFIEIEASLKPLYSIRLCIGEKIIEKLRG